MNAKIIVISVLLLATFGCGIRSETPQSYLARRNIVPARAGCMTVCSGFGCTRLAKVTLAPAQLLHLDVMFTPRPETAQEERALIARAVAWLEITVGPLAGTQGDLRKNQRNYASSGQLDCIAEATNTTVYLLMLRDKGLLSHHSVAPPESRGGSVFTAHNTAVIADGNGKEFAVDSWFHGNGDLPEIVDLPSWRNGFDPDDLDSKEQSVDAEDAMGDEHGV